MEIVPVQYDLALVFTSILLAMVATYTALSHVNRLRSTEVQRHQSLWLLLASLCMGGGIWSMHFVAMMSSNPQYAIRFDIYGTLVSFLVPVLGTMLSFRLMYTFNEARTAIAAGTLMGLTIVTMHYLGINAVKRSLTVLHDDPNYVMVAVTIAITVSILSLYIAFKNIAEGFKTKLVSAFLLGTAVSGMHFAGVLGQTIYVLPVTGQPTVVSSYGSLDKAELGVIIAFISFIILFTSIIAGLSADSNQRKINNDQLKLLINELNHRVKNTLATVQSLANHSLKGIDPKKLKTFESRLISLAKVHTLLTESNWESISLCEIVKGEIELYTMPGGPYLEMFGPVVRLKPSIGAPLEMVIHEMATNAVKYGALSVSQGHLSVDWEIVDGDIVLNWVETGGPVPTNYESKGFGSMLIRQTMKQIGGTVHKDFHPWGLACVLTFPFSNVK